MPDKKLVKIKETCYRCGIIYEAELDNEIAENLCDNFDPTDWECPECINAYYEEEEG